MNLNRLNAPYVQQFGEQRTSNGGLIRRAIVWGDRSVKLTEPEVLKIWLSKPRKTSTPAMLAKLQCESSFMPYIARYEIGQHIDNPAWKFKDEFNSTSFGLFQFMGFHLKGEYAVKDQAKPFESFTIEKQFDLYDEYFFNLLVAAKRMFPDLSQDQLIWRAFAGYQGNFSPGPNSSITTLTEKNYKVYLEKKKNYPI